MKKATRLPGLVLPVGIFIFALSPGCRKKQEPAANKDESAPSRPPPAGTKEDHALRFVDLMVRGEFETAVYRFTPKMKSLIPQDKLTQLWEGIVSNLGPFQNVVKTGTQRRRDLTAVTVTARFKKDRLNIRVVLNEKNQVAGLFFKPFKKKYPYRPEDGREGMTTSFLQSICGRVLRGGRHDWIARLARCACRQGTGPGIALPLYGFRVASF